MPIMTEHEKLQDGHLSNNFIEYQAKFPIFMFVEMTNNFEIPMLSLE